MAMTQFAGLIPIPDQNGERFCFTAFALSQALNSVFVAGIDEQLKTADAFQGDDAPRYKRLFRLPQGIVILCQDLAFFLAQAQTRSAGGTCDSLRVESAIRGIGIFLCTARAKRECRHRGVFAVKGQLSQDAEARPTSGAGEERIAEAMIPGIEQFPETVETGSLIRWEAWPWGRSREARADHETGFPGNREERGRAGLCR
jgi:hypothetical protein